MADECGTSGFSAVNEAFRQAARDPQASMFREVLALQRAKDAGLIGDPSVDAVEGLLWRFGQMRERCAAADAAPELTAAARAIAGYVRTLERRVAVLEGGGTPLVSHAATGAASELAAALWDAAAYARELERRATVFEGAGATAGPRADAVGRRSDMDPSIALRLRRQEDGDIIASVGAAGARFHDAAAEFCTANGGGRSPRTMAALRALWVAMEQDTRDRPDAADG